MIKVKSLDRFRSQELEQILTSRIDSVIPTDEEFLQKALNGESARVQTINLHHLALGLQDPVFNETIRTADYVTADGWPVVRMFRVLGKNVHRVTGASFIEELTFSHEGEGRLIGLLGATTDVGDEWETMLATHDRKLVLRDHGLAEDWNAPELARRAMEVGVDILVIAVTPPRGDNFARELREAGFPGVIVPVGGAIDMVTGHRPRAPKWAQTWGIEWFHRLLSEPGRLWRRYMLECVPMMIKFAPIALRRKLQGARHVVTPGRDHA